MLPEKFVGSSVGQNVKKNLCEEKLRERFGKALLHLSVADKVGKRVHEGPPGMCP